MDADLKVRFPPDNASRFIDTGHMAQLTPAPTDTGSTSDHAHDHTHDRSSDLAIRGIDLDELAVRLAEGIDCLGNPIDVFTDHDGGWPLRCCLDRSRPGDTIAIIAWSPFAWHGPYRETGPIVVHAADCAGAPSAEVLPEMIERGPMTLRPYGRDQMIAYAAVRHVPAGEALRPHVEELLCDEDIDFVHGRNVTGGCWAFEARRATDEHRVTG